MTSPEHPMQLADYVRELTQPHHHAEHYTTRVAGEWRGLNHITRNPPLIAQLWAGDVPSAAAEEGPRPAYDSKPTARLDALDTAARIDLEASRWVKDLGEDDPGDELETITHPAASGPVCQACDHRSCGWIRRSKIVERRPIPGSGTAACVRLLGALAAGLKPTDPTYRAIEHDVRRWWIRARIVTGWDTPPWSPDATCPQCTERGSLRIRLADKIATCSNDACQAVWTSETIGLLADHIRGETMDGRTRATAAAVCWCPWPRPDVPAWVFCPVCGSRHCHRALEVVQLVATEVLAGAMSTEIRARHGARYKLRQETIVRLIRWARYGDAGTAHAAGGRMGA